MAADLFGEVGSALYSRLTGGTALMAVANSVWNTRADTSSANVPPTTPYVRFQYAAAAENDTAGRSIHVLLYDVLAVDDQRYPERAGSVAAEVFALLNRSPLTLSSYTNTGLIYRTPVQFRDPGGYWNVGWTFEIHVSKTS